MNRPIGLVIAACCFALTVIGSRDSVAVDVSPPPWRQSTDFVEEATGGLRMAGRYDEADALAKDIVRRVRDDPGAPPHTEEIAQQAERTLARLASLPKSEQITFHDLELDYRTKKECWHAKEYSLFARSQSRLLQAVERIFGHDDYETARQLIEAEHNFRNWGHLVQAEHCAREALAIDRRLFPVGHPVVIDAQADLAFTLMSQGRMDEAEPLLRKVLAFTIAHDGERSKGAAGGYNSLALALLAEGNYEEAAELQGRTEEIQRANCGADHEIYLNNYARTLIQLGRLDDAEWRVRKSLGIYMHSYGENCSEVAGLLASLAEIEQQRGALGAADSLYARAAAIDRAVLGADHPEFLRPQIRRAEIQLQLGRPAMARTLLEPLLPALDPSLRVRERSRCLLIVGRALREQGRSAEAEPLLAESARLYERARERAGGEFKRATLNLASPYSDLALGRLDMDRPETAWLAVESGLGRCLQDLLLANHAKSPIESAHADSLRQILSEREERLVSLTAQLSADSSLQAERREAEAELLDAEAAWSRSQSEFLRNHTRLPDDGISLSQVQAALDGSTAIIGWVDGDGTGPRKHDAWGYVIRGGAPVRWVRLPLHDGDPSAAGGGTATAYRAALVGASARPIRVSINDQIDRSARSIAQERIAPLLPLLGGIRRIVVIPSGPMLGIPVEALQFEDGVWLSDRFEVAYAPSATVFAMLATDHRQPASSADRILLVGDPAFATPSEPVATVTPVSGQGFANASSSRMDLPVMERSVVSTTGDVLRSFRPLPQSRAEIRAIAGMYPHAKVLLGRQASTEALAGLVSSGKMAQFHILHFATHALVDDRTPERSGLVLSQIRRPKFDEEIGDAEPAADGCLKVKQIVRDWHLDADLVTLSGCSTDLGRPAGGEGYIGLAQAFLLAGARSVLVSLWSVDDEATSLFMRRFYADLTGNGVSPAPGRAMSKTAALEEARRYVRDYQDSTGTYRFRHPCYWAAFVLVGSPD